MKIINNHRDDDYYCLSKIFEDNEGRTHAGICVYYFWRVKERIVNFDKIWGKVCYLEKKSNSDSKLYELIHSLSQKYEHLLFSFDQVERMAGIKKPDNDDVFFTTYFAYNFITTAKAFCDIVAWVVCEICDISIKAQRVSIFFSNEKRSSLFKGKITLKCNDSFKAAIFDKEIQQGLFKIEKDRDLLIHKGELPIMRFINCDTGEQGITRHDKNIRPTKRGSCKDYLEKDFNIIDKLFFEINELVSVEFENYCRRKGLKIIGPDEDIKTFFPPSFKQAKN